MCVWGKTECSQGLRDGFQNLKLSNPNTGIINGTSKTRAKVKCLEERIMTMKWKHNASFRVPAWLVVPVSNVSCVTVSNKKICSLFLLESGLCCSATCCLESPLLPQLHTVETWAWMVLLFQYCISCRYTETDAIFSCMTFCFGLNFCSALWSKKVMHICLCGACWSVICYWNPGWHSCGKTIAQEMNWPQGQALSRSLSVSVCNILVMFLMLLYQDLQLTPCLSATEK